MMTVVMMRVVVVTVMVMMIRMVIRNHIPGYFKATIDKPRNKTLFKEVKTELKKRMHLISLLKNEAKKKNGLN